MILVKVSNADHIQGSSSAPIILVEYGDYQCPYCRKANRIVKQLQENLGNQLTCIFRNYPLQDLHPNALHAAIAAETANIQGKFWEMHDMIFENQRNLDDSSLISYAKEIGLDVTQFEKDFGSQPTVEKVEEDINSGNRFGVEGTPTFFVNGKFFSGDWSSDEFLDYLKTLL
jgi:protein-disulfide isomerase